MNTIDDLLQRLDATGPTGWEDEYARHLVEITHDQAVEVVASARACAAWFAFRSDAGRPGVPLPPVHEAVGAVLGGPGATPLDAYCVVFSTRPLPDGVSSDGVLAILCNSAIATLRGGATRLGTWLAARAGLAAIALGAPEHAWRFLDGLTGHGRRHPHLDELAIFAPLRGHPALERNTWVRLAICRFWGNFGVSVVPRLPFEPPADEKDESLPATLAALARVGADRVRDLVESLAEALDQAVLHQHDDDPLVRDLRARAMVPGSSAPPVDELPAWFGDWARAVGRTGQPHLARLAGLVLRHADVGAPQFTAVLVLVAARASDLDVLAAGFGDTELEALIEELVAAARVLPAAVADALVATAIPHHVDSQHALPVLALHLGELEAVAATPGGMVEHVIQMVRSMVQARAREHESARPRYERLREATRRAAARWPAPRVLDARDMERAVDSIDVPELTIGLLELALESGEFAPVETLLLALSLRGAVEGTEHEHPWRAAFAKLASDTIYVLRATALFALRLELLDELLATAHPRSSPAELYFQRANTRQVISTGRQGETNLILADMRTAMSLARAEGDLGRYASTTAAWVKLLARPASGGDHPDDVSFDDANQAIEEALRLPMEPFDQALLHQARAHMIRRRNPLDAVHAFEFALTLVPPDDAFWSELAAELVTTLALAGRADEAAVRGNAFLACASCDTDQVELGMLHLATGEALASVGRSAEARERLEAGLTLVRGCDAHNESLAHLHLARLGLMTGDRELTGEHLRLLRDRREDLDLQLRRDFHSVEAAAAGAAGHFDAQRTALQQVLSLTRDETPRTRLRLELARIDLAAGQAGEPLDYLIELAMALSIDRALAAVLIDLVCIHDPLLSAATREALIGWAVRGGRSSIVARMQDRAGRAGDARTTLRTALSAALDDHERIACLHLLLTVLDPRDREERRRLCLELERQLDELHDVPHVRMDLAQGLLMDAEGALDTLHRARRHVLRALEGVPDRGLVEQGHRLMGRILIESARAALPESSGATAEDLSPLLGDLSLPAAEAARLRLAAAQVLLLPGPIVHPQALGMARRLIVQAPEDEHAGQLLARLEWIERRAESGARVEAVPAVIGGPLDSLPSWLIGLIHARSTQLDPEDVGENVAWLVPALQARPDVADRVLGELLLLQHRLAPMPRRDLLEAIYTMIQSIPLQDGAEWTALRDAMATVRREHRHSTLRLIESAQRRVSQRLSGRLPDIAPDEGSEPECEGRDRGRARGCFERGVGLMQSVLSAPAAPEAEQRIVESRDLLAEAVRLGLGREQQMPEVVDFLVSQGNAWKTAPGEDIDQALQLYDVASELDATSEQKAKLWKVQADALRQRGRPEDLRRAAGLLEQALEIRRGWLRAETLVSAARVALNHPDLETGEREVRAAGHLMDAVRVDPGHAAPMLRFLLARLAAWHRLRPEDERPVRLRDELKTFYPERAAEIERPIAVPQSRDIEVLKRLWKHPAWASFFEVRRRLTSIAERSSDPFGIMERFDPSDRDAFEERTGQESLLGNPVACRTAIAALHEVTTGAARPGALAARVLLLAHLARLAECAVGEVRDATAEACAALDEVDDLLVRAALLREIATAWAPDDHCDDPVRDFGLSAELLRQCVTMEGGEALAVSDTLVFLARALRYSSVGDLQANLRESCRIYGLCLERARASGGGDSIAGLLQNLGEVESQMGVGTRQDRLLHNIERLREAVAIAHSACKRAQCTANLAWELTQLGTMHNGVEGQRRLQEALTTFDQVDLAQVGEDALRYLAGNRTVCEAWLARLSAGRDAEIDVWRRHLASLDPATVPYLVATAKHNLAGVLLTGPNLSPEEFAEGLRLSREAAAVRTIPRNPRHHWETALNTARALLDTLRTGRLRRLPQSPRAVIGEARRWLHRAIAAARILGPGEELTMAAYGLCEFGLMSASIEEMIEHTEEAWAVVREAAPYLLLHGESREREARIALHTAAVLAGRLAERTPAVATPGLTFVLQDQHAETVARWLFRGQEPARRPLRARLSRPRAVSAGVWGSWLSALDSRDGRRVADALDRVRADAPEFPSDSFGTEPTWRWLQAHPGSIAIAVMLAEPVSLALVLQVDGDGRRRTWVLGLRLPPPPLPLETLPDLMRGAASGVDAGGAQERVAAWLRENVVAPVESFLGAPPSTVLWSPGPGLRLVAPGAIWRGVPVATTTTLALPDLTTSPGRRRSTLVVLADPGSRAPEPRLDLRGQGVPALEALSRAAAASGTVRVLGSVGERSGRALLPASENVRDTPASARDVLAEAGEHQVIVLVAHGEVESLDDAAVVCIDGDGRLDRLDVTRIGREPDRFAGATVLLLSCEGGRVGDALADPGGIAGTLMSAGARCVVAPLWPVRLDVAVQVGEAVLRGIAEGDSPWEVLAKLRIVGAGRSPLLGGPPPSLSERQATHDLQALAFVTWVG